MSTAIPHVSAHPRKAPAPILAAPLLQARQLERSNYPAFLSTQPVDEQDVWLPLDPVAERSIVAGLIAALMCVLVLLCHLLTTPTK